MKFSSIPSMIRTNAKKYGTKVVMRYKKDGVWKELKWFELYEAMIKTALGLIKYGLQPGDRVAILSENRPHWAISDLAILSCGAIDVPIYTTNTPEQCAYVLRDSGSKFIFVSTKILLNKILEKFSSLPSLEKIIIFDMEEGVEGSDKIIRFEDLQRAGEGGNPQIVEDRISNLGPDNFLTFIYTSGTTGEPKGVMLTHGNLLSNIESSASILPINEKDEFLSFLPLSHSFERMGGYYTSLYCGATINYAESIEKLVDNLGEIKPSFMCAVPRIFEKVYAGFQQQLKNAPPLKKKIMGWALLVGNKVSRLKEEGKNIPFFLNLQFGIAEKLVFSKLQKKLGGRIRFLVSGGAPLSSEIERFFHSAGILVLEGYGLTETSPVIAVNRVEKYRFGSVGSVIPGVEVKIADDGEILVRGPNVMKGYYKKETETKESFTDDGWFKTGDIGEIDKDGFLKITDRKKELIKTAGGKFVAPQPIENKIKLFPVVDQVVVIGDKRPYCIALIVPNFDELKKVLKEKGIEEENVENLINNQEVLKIYEGIKDKINQDLAPFEQIKKLHLLKTPFTQENNMLTPTLKARRSVITKVYYEEIEKVYSV